MQRCGAHRPNSCLLSGYLTICQDSDSSEGQDGRQRPARDMACGSDHVHHASCTSCAGTAVRPCRETHRIGLLGLRPPLQQSGSEPERRSSRRPRRANWAAREAQGTGRGSQQRASRRHATHFAAQRDVDTGTAVTRGIALAVRSTVSATRRLCRAEHAWRGVVACGRCLGHWRRRGGQVVVRRGQFEIAAPWAFTLGAPSTVAPDAGAHVRDRSDPHCRWHQGSVDRRRDRAHLRSASVAGCWSAAGSEANRAPRHCSG